MHAARLFLSLNLLCALTACGSRQPDAPAAPRAVAVGDALPGSDAPAAEAALRPTTPPDAGPELAPDVAPEVASADDPQDSAVVVPADTVAPPAPLPPDLPTIAGLTPAAVARALDPTPGCVALAKNGRGVLLIEEAAPRSAAAKPESVLRFVPFRAGARFPDDSALVPNDRGVPASEFRPLVRAARDDWASAVRAASAEGGLGLGASRLEACQTTVAVDGALRVAKPVPIAVETRGAEHAVVATIDGNAPVAIAVEGRLAAAYWSDATDDLVLAVEEVDAHPRRTTWATIAPSELGNSACLPVTRAAAAPLPPPDLTVRSECLAMTPDGKGAAFGSQWLGVAARAAKGGELDVSCLTHGCPPETDAEIKRLGLVGCHEAAGTISVDGHPVELGTHGTDVRLRMGSRWRTVAHLGPNERLAHAFQHPRGGPVYLSVHRSYTEELRNGTKQRLEQLYQVVPDEGLVACAAPPGMVWGVLAKASSSAGAKPDAKFGANALVDGDLTTSWQPADPKPNAPPTWVELTLPAATEVMAIEIANGFQRRDGYGDLFAMNARVAAATLEFDDGTREELTFDANARGFKRFTFAPRRTGKVKLTVTAQHPGARWPNDLNLSEVRLVAASGG